MCCRCPKSLLNYGFVIVISVPPHDDHWSYPGHPLENCLAPPLLSFSSSSSSATEALYNIMYMQYCVWKCVSVYLQSDFNANV